MDKGMYYKETGDGFYSKNNPFSELAYQQVIKIVSKFQSDKGPCYQKEILSDKITIADYGCADGAALLSILPELLALMKTMFGEREFKVVFQDSRNNDFKAVIGYAQEFTKRALATSKPCDIPHFSFVGDNFYKRCLPNNSVSIGICCTALHWLSYSPCKLTTLMDTQSTDNSCVRQFSDVAGEDWQRFLLLRAEELHNGGILVLLVIGMDSSGRYVGCTQPHRKSLHQLFTEQWQVWHSKEQLTETVVERATYLTFPLFFQRTAEDMKKPFQDENSLVRRSGLELVSHDEWILESPNYEKYVKAKDCPSSAASYADAVVTTYKTWSYNVLASSLDEHRLEVQQNKLLEEYYNRLRVEIARNPDLYVDDYVYHCVVVRKTL